MQRFPGYDSSDARAQTYEVCGRLTSQCKKKKHWTLRPQKPLRLIRDGEVGESLRLIRDGEVGESLRLIRDGEVGESFLFFIFLSNTYSLHCHHQNDCIKVGSCVSHFNVSLIVWARSQDSVRKPQFLKRRERRAEADRTKVLLLTRQAPYTLYRAFGTITLLYPLSDQIDAASLAVVCLCALQQRGRKKSNSETLPVGMVIRTRIKK